LAVGRTPIWGLRAQGGEGRTWLGGRGAGPARPLTSADRLSGIFFPGPVPGDIPRAARAFSSMRGACPKTACETEPSPLALKSGGARRERPLAPAASRGESCCGAGVFFQGSAPRQFSAPTHTLTQQSLLATARVARRPSRGVASPMTRAVRDVLRSSSSFTGRGAVLYRKLADLFLFRGLRQCHHLPAKFIYSLTKKLPPLTHKYTTGGRLQAGRLPGVTEEVRRDDGDNANDAALPRTFFSPPCAPDVRSLPLP